MIKDTKGIVWFGTMFGLIMHDGSNYIRFIYDPLDSKSISIDDVTSIFEDSKGFLWFGTYTAVSIGTTESQAHSKDFSQSGDKSPTIIFGM